MDMISNAKEIQVEAIITRADGTIVNLGVVDYWHKNPVKRIIWKLSQWVTKSKNVLCVKK